MVHTSAPSEMSDDHKVAATSSSPTLQARDVIHLVSLEPPDSDVEPHLASTEVSRPTLPEKNSGGSSLTSHSVGTNARLNSIAGQWKEWIARYAEGEWDGSVPPEPPIDIVAVHESAGAHVDASTTEGTAAKTHEWSESKGPSDADISNAAATSARGSPIEGGFMVLPSSSFSTQSSNSSKENMEAQASHLLDFYRRHGYLPGPKSVHESQRLRIMQRYRLDEKDRKKSISRICSLARSHFQSSSVIITLVLENHSVVAAESAYDPSGRDPSLSEPVRVLPDLPISLCTHGILRRKNDPADLFIVPDVTKDWRFAKNPQAVSEGGALGHYMSANILLQVPSATSETSSAPDTPGLLPVGSICVLGSKPLDLDTVTKSDRLFLSLCADMIAREFQLGYESTQRSQEQRQSSFIGKLLEKTLVQPLQPRNGISSDSSAPSTRAVKDGQQAVASSAVSDSFNTATEQFMRLTGSTSAAVLDLRSFRCPGQRTPNAKRSQKGSASSARPSAAPTPVFHTSREPSSPINTDNTFQKGTFEGEDLFQGSSSAGKIYLMSASGDVEWSKVVEEEAGTLGHAVRQSLEDFYVSGRTCFEAESGLSALSSILPLETAASCVVPIFDDGAAALLVVLTSSTRFAAFDSNDSKFAQNVGSVLTSALLRERAMAVDQAKLAFVSQISHELRTPLHGVTSQLELIREFSSPSQMSRLAPMLDVCDVCLESLRDVLDHTLEYAKFSGTVPDEEVVRRAFVVGDLARLAEDVTKATWVRKRRIDLVAADGSDAKGSSVSQGANALTNDVDLILEVYDRRDGWNALIDTGGLKRCLLNWLGNALKWTTHGHVKLSLREASAQEGAMVKCRARQQAVIIEVTDTGKGMEESFVRQKLFTPFVQADPFAQGAGLGMSLSLQIVQRLGGKIDVVSGLGTGTVIKCTLPVDFTGEGSVPSSPIHSRPSTSGGSATPQRSSSPWTQSHAQQRQPVRRIISDELIALFNPGTRLSATPSDEKAAFDFTSALDAAHTALVQPSATLKRIPSARNKRPHLNDKTRTTDLVDEVAKLSVTTQVGSPPMSSFKVEPFPSADHRIAKHVIPRIPLATRVNVLFADDNPIARSILAKLFTGKGITFSAACDGQQAVDMYKTSSTPFHLFLADLQMPNKDGIEASHEIRQHELEQGLPRCRIIALTGLNNEADMSKAGVLRDDGPVDAWLTKGGKSLRFILDEVTALQAELDAQATTSGSAGLIAA